MKKLLLGSLLSSMVLLAACGNGETGAGDDTDNGNEEIPEEAADATVIRFLNGFTGGDGAFMKEIVDNFNDSQDEYFVNESQEPEHYTQFRTGDYELVVMHGVNLETYSMDGLIQPIDGILEDVGMSINDFHPAAEDLVGLTDGNYGIPLDIHPLTTFYNKNLTEEAPETYEDLVTLSEELQSENENLYAMGIPDSGLIEFYTLTLAAQNNVDLLSDDERYLNFAQEDLVDALWILHDMIYEDNISPEGLGLDGEFHAFMQDSEGDSGGNQTAVSLTGPWYYQAVSDAYGDDLGIGTIPQLGEQVAVYGNSHVISLAASVEDEDMLEGISAFIEFMYQPENLSNWAASGQAPLHTETMNYIEENAEDFPLPYQNQQMFDDYVAAPAVYQFGEQMRYMNETVIGRIVREENLTREELMEELETATGIAEEIADTAPEQ
ncbi:extracellular solute-binding protein [Alkalibacterium pelagium]|uniref:Multiple sugar transport system substrate-binding protein n=1 Tax=Alkalibacterium pelagium TaxID=426702 RepID=A0A1H7HME2_9LACT|nr:extracellular solute-binding protein [Alkalibacterium pelagium]GEN50400.1 ABC transporter substrate-binding protein [Alkalibacterium pelagium]SEK51441.1 multiple sugar transport system substrate-binding protein [Alkalibacterium pelagium]